MGWTLTCKGVKNASQEQGSKDTFILFLLLTLDVVLSSKIMLPKVAFGQDIILFLFRYKCVWLCACEHKCRYLQRPEEGTFGSHWSWTSGGCELHTVGAGNCTLLGSFARAERAFNHSAPFSCPLVTVFYHSHRNKARTKLPRKY